jgi:ribulose-phosphate 3-epimerase
MDIPKLSPIPIGLTLNPSEQVSDLESHYNLDNVPSIQIMSVTPGVQGNPFIPETLNKIEQLRVHGYRFKIFLDGAVNDKTLPAINKQKFKPDVICPGSFLTKAKDLEKNVEYLKNYV